jgi:hypothetical protein
MATLHHIYTVTHIYNTFKLLFISFFILLLLLWAGWLAQTPLVCHTSHLLISTCWSLKAVDAALDVEEGGECSYFIIPTFAVSHGPVGKGKNNNSHLPLHL